MRMRINGEAADIVIMIWMKTEDGDHDNHDNLIIMMMMMIRKKEAL